MEADRRAEDSTHSRWAEYKVPAMALGKTMYMNKARLASQTKAALSIILLPLGTTTDADSTVCSHQTRTYLPNVHSSKGRKPVPHIKSH